MEELPYDVLSNYIISFCNVNNIDVTNKKLQKLMYYCDAWHLALFKAPIVSNEFEAWVHGAVLRPLYSEYAIYGYDSIQLNIESAKENINNFRELVKASTYDIINKVLNKYFRLSADELECKNHAEYPWRHAREGLSANTSCDRKISKTITMNYYSSRALLEEMKAVKCSIFKTTPDALKKAQERLSKRTLFKKTAENFGDYEKYILDSYDSSRILTERAEYGRKI